MAAFSTLLFQNISGEDAQRPLLPDASLLQGDPTGDWSKMDQICLVRVTLSMDVSSLPDSAAARFLAGGGPGGGDPGGPGGGPERK